MHRLVLIALTLGVLIGLTPAGATAPPKGTAQLDAGTQPARGFQVCPGPIPHAPETGLLCTATSDSGYSIEMNGTGRWDANSVTGVGTWVIREPGGLPVDAGIWLPTVVPDSFESWGTTFDLPETDLGTPRHLDIYPAEGGEVHLVIGLYRYSLLPNLSGYQAFLTIRCRIGPGTPPDAIEGIEVNVPAFANFNHTQLGGTLFERIPVY